MPNYKGIYQATYSDLGDISVVEVIYDIEKIIEKLNFVKMTPNREISLAVTKLEEAQLWLTQV